MKKSEVLKLKLPDTPGVYFFHGPRNEILYIGKATSIHNRVRSYFSGDLIETRGPHIVKMVERSQRVTYQQTGSVLEALLLEARYIKENQPMYNSREKDDKSLNYVVITNEDFPRVLYMREKELYGNADRDIKIKYSFGPFPHGTPLKESLRIIRRIFPYRDTCNAGSKRACFNRQIGLCPGVCTGEITKTEYAKTVRYIRAFLMGKKQDAIRHIKKEMKRASDALEFEKAGEFKKTLFSLEHINDIALIRDDLPKIYQGRVEAYDVAHISGSHMVGVMVVLEGGSTVRSAYRKFKIRTTETANDTRALREIISRRLVHAEWRYPTLIVADGGVAQKRAVEQVLRDSGAKIPVVAVVKDNHHKPKKILGDTSFIAKHEREILLANSEAHHFAVSYHRQKRDRIR